MEQSTWKPVNGYEGLYQINSVGIIKSLHRRTYNKVISQRIDRAGYWTVKLHKHGKDCTVYVHRLLAFAFIGNPDNKPAINHINGIKTDNTLENLEWVTYSENMIHACLTGLSKKPPSVTKKVIDMCGKKEYLSIKEAAEDLHISYKTLCNMLSGKRKNKTCLQLAA